MADARSGSIQRATHVGSLEPTCESLLRRLDPLESATGVVLAVSGGSDSTALMHLAAAWVRSGPCPPVTVASVDHGLRPEARQEADGVVLAARHLGFDAHRLDWVGDKPHTGLAEQSRIARYDLLAAHAHQLGASHIVTAHTIDDQAETVLLRLARGSGASGLGGMRRTTSMQGLTLMRPLLDVRKADLVVLCRTNGWLYIEDPTNLDPTYARARWRALAPLLDSEGMTSERLAVFAERMVRIEVALARFAADAEEAALLDRSATCRSYRMAAVTAQPAEVVLRILGIALVTVSRREQPRLERLEHLAADLVTAAREGRTLSRTLHHCLVKLGRDGILLIYPEGERRRGTQSTTPAAFRPRSLGKGTHASYIASVDAPARQPDVVETHCSSEPQERTVMLAAGWQ